MNRIVIVFVTFCAVIQNVFLSNLDPLIENRISEVKCQSFCREKTKYPGSTTDDASSNCNVVKCNCTVHQTTNSSKAFPEFAATPLDSPQLKCKEENLAHLTWRIRLDFVYFFEVVGPKDKSTSLSAVTRCGDLTLTNLIENTNYKVRLWGVSRKLNQYKKSEFIEFKTLDGQSHPLPVTDIFLIDKLYLQDDKYVAVIGWSPSEDLSCFYNFVWFGSDDLGDFGEKEVSDPKTLYKITLKNLNFDTNYTIAVRARKAVVHLESEKTDFYISTPSCIDTYLTLDKCRPTPPQDLTVEEDFIEDIPYRDPPRYDVKLKWSKPDFLPAFYVASFKNFIPVNNNSGMNLTIAGDQTNATFKNIELGMYYHVSLTAWSRMGPSDPAYQNRHVTGTRTAIIRRPKVTRPKPWTVLELTLVIAGPITIACLIIGSYYFIKHYKAKRGRVQKRCKYFLELDRKAPDGTQSMSVTFVTGEEESITTPDEWELSSNDVLLQNVLGEGAFGIVRRGYLLSKDDSRCEVAVKMLKEKPTSEEMRQFSQEIEIMKSVKRHLHVVSLIGCITSGRPEGPLLVVEYCSRGDLQSYLRTAWDKLTNLSQRDPLYVDQSSESSGKYFANQTYELQDDGQLSDYVIQPKHLISIARQVAMGMEHLARTRVVHRDLAARNVLVCEDHTVKVSDFGLSRDVYQDNVYFKTGAGKLPVRWMAIESLTHQRYTTQSDVWSFGILLWEIVTLGGTPYATIHSRDLLQLLSSGQRLEQPGNCSDELYEIMLTCWRSSPNDRPTFTELRQSLDGLLESVSHYLNLEIDSVPNIFKNEKIISRSQTPERYVNPINSPKK